MNPFVHARTCKIRVHSDMRSTWFVVYIFGKLRLLGCMKMTFEDEKKNVHVGFSGFEPLMCRALCVCVYVFVSACICSCPLVAGCFLFRFFFIVCCFRRLNS